jgi:hypothetical protein
VVSGRLGSWVGVLLRGSGVLGVGCVGGVCYIVCRGGFGARGESFGRFSHVA